MNTTAAAAKAQVTVANLVRDLAGTERGGKSRAAAQIGVEDDQRRERLAAAVREARER